MANIQWNPVIVISLVGIVCSFPIIILTIMGSRKVTDAQIIKYWTQQRHPSRREIAKHFGCAERTVKKVVEAVTKKDDDIHKLHERRVILELELKQAIIGSDDEDILKDLEIVYKQIMNQQ
jgi:hypothetical protein